MGSIIGIIIFVLDILAILNIVKSSMATGKKLIWILVVLFLPVLGLVLYYLLGKKG